MLSINQYPDSIRCDDMMFAKHLSRGAIYYYCEMKLENGVLLVEYNEGYQKYKVWIPGQNVTYYCTADEIWCYIKTKKIPEYKNKVRIYEKPKNNSNIQIIWDFTTNTT